MRLDKYLKVSRLIKRRTVANEACDAGRVTVNGKVAKASVNVKVGDIIEIQFGQKTVKVRVLDVDVKKKRISLTMRLDDEAEKKAAKPAKKKQKRRSQPADITKLKNSSFRIKQK